MAPQYVTIFQCTQILEFTVFPMYGVPPKCGIFGISSTRSIVIAWVKNLRNGFFFAPKVWFMLPCPYVC